MKVSLTVQDLLWYWKFSENLLYTWHLQSMFWDIKQKGSMFIHRVVCTRKKWESQRRSNTNEKEISEEPSWRKWWLKGIKASRITPRYKDNWCGVSHHVWDGCSSLFTFLLGKWRLKQMEDLGIHRRLPHGLHVHLCFRICSLRMKGVRHKQKSPCCKAKVEKRH